MRHMQSLRGASLPRSRLQYSLAEVGAVGLPCLLSMRQPPASVRGSLRYRLCRLPVRHGRCAGRLRQVFGAACRCGTRWGSRGQGVCVLQAKKQQELDSALAELARLRVRNPVLHGARTSRDLARISGGHARENGSQPCPGQGDAGARGETEGGFARIADRHTEVGGKTRQGLFTLCVRRN